VDETYVGGKPRKGTGKHPTGRATKKAPVLALVERGGRAHARPIQNVTAKTLKTAVREMVHPDSRIMTDDWPAYRGLATSFTGGHSTVNHSKGEYARWDEGERVSTNEVEAYFALLKRGVMGTFHHVSKEHLHRYCDEFSFRWNTRTRRDDEVAAIAIRGAEGKRLMYKPKSS
jgi:transposase-like protein